MDEPFTSAETLAAYLQRTTLSRVVLMLNIMKPITICTMAIPEMGDPSSTQW